MDILLLEQDPGLGAAICAACEPDGHVIAFVRNSAHARRCIDAAPPDLLILDALPHNGSALALLTEWRGAGLHCPAIVMLAAPTASDRIRAFDAGADDCIAKPFEIAELRVRVRALLRRAYQPAATELRHRDICLDRASHRVTKSGRPVALSKRLFAVLNLLLQHRGSALPRRAIEEALYSWEQDVESNTVQVYIHHLRQTFGKDFIRTIRGVGYMIESD